MIEEFEMKKSRCGFLRHSDVQGFFYLDFHPSSHGPPPPGNPNFLYKLKNDPHHSWSQRQLQCATIDLKETLKIDLPQMLDLADNLTVCVVPRAKAESFYREDQLLFRKTVSEAVRSMPGFQDGSDFIIRHENTETTHLQKPIEGFNNDGPKPYPGIACDTCHFAPQIGGRDILLVDDIYTRNVGIDEDMAQALFDKGAHSVVFYAVGRTVGKY